MPFKYQIVESVFKMVFEEMQDDQRHKAHKHKHKNIKFINKINIFTINKAQDTNLARNFSMTVLSYLSQHKHSFL